MIPFGAEFEFIQARIIFGANKLEVPWMVGEPMPPDLPDKIIEAIQPAATIGQAAAAPTTSLGLPPNHAAPMSAASPTPSAGAAAAKVNTQETVGALLGSVNLSAFVPYFEEEGYDYVRVGSNQCGGQRRGRARGRLRHEEAAAKALPHDPG